MSGDGLIATATALMADHKGLLAMDESNATCNRRFASAGIPQTEAARRAWRELIVTTPGLATCISGAILYDETIGQTTSAGSPFATALAALGIIPGIKVDTGAQPLALHPGETVTEGLDGLRARLQAYAAMGARFAKWRGVIAIGERLPTSGCIAANTHALARYAALCQAAGLVPVVEPEVLMDGGHPLAVCRDATEAVLRQLFVQLQQQGVALEAMILKPNMIASGLTCLAQASVEAVAEATVTAFRRVVPAAVAGIAFLSGGQTGELASARLNAINGRFTPASPPPWPLTFSFARAIQQPALQIWHGEAAQVTAAQAALLHRARCNLAARRGEYRAVMEAA